jgi:hypothetical protein
MDDLSKLLDKGTGFYHELITTLRCDHNVDLSNVAAEILQSESGITKNKQPTSLPDPKPVQNRRNGRSRQPSRILDESIKPTFTIEAIANCIQKCFVYLGDLARYRTKIRLDTQLVLSTAQSSNPSRTRPSPIEWQAARRFYTRAIYIFPDSAKPFGQLAILSSYVNDDIESLYWYSLR